MHEVEFCAQIKSWLDALFAQHPEWPFEKAAIEQYGAGSMKRSDLRVYARDRATPVLTGEVKMPGTQEGRNPLYDPLVEDAERKAARVQCQHFFTWNVQHFVLFDRSLWQRSPIERCLKSWIMKPSIRKRDDCDRPDVTAYLRDVFLPDLFTFFAKIVQGELKNWGEPPDVIFIQSLESHLAWPVDSTATWMENEAFQDKTFAARLQAWMAQEMGWSFNPDDAEDWHAALDRAARTLCYQFSNQIIFYEALRGRYRDRLTPLHMPNSSKEGGRGILAGFRAAFQNAVRESGDYESIFAPQMDDWALSLVFSAPEVLTAWNAMLANLTTYDFRKIPYDIVGGIFQRLISPEERQRFGQFFTHEDIIDVINAFCIRRAGDVVLDPACGSGSFLVRAYHRKAWLAEHRHAGRRNRDHQLSHSELLREIFGCDISHFAAHLATLNLAARHITDEENYPCIARRNFFEIPENRKEFCMLPGGLRDAHGRRAKAPVPLPTLDAVIGNPPYVRQEKIPKAADILREKGHTRESLETRRRESKEFLLETCRRDWPGLKLSGRSDLHCYFWPVAAGMLKDDGMFGFLTSSSWLDVEYGFDLQRWILENFKIVAIVESLDEPWFSDARIKTAVTILQRCRDQAEREANTVRFVRLLKPLRDILSLTKEIDEGARQKGAENLREIILKTKRVFANEQMRIVPVSQKQLWDEGVHAAELLTRQPVQEIEPNEDAEIAEGENSTPYETDGESSSTMEIGEAAAAAFKAMQASPYAAGKWGRFLRAPDIYFRLLERCADRFVRLGEITEVRFGIKSGCDHFFMPRDVTAKMLERAPDEMAWNNIMLLAPCKRRDVASGKLRIIEAGDGTLHPVEARYLRPEVHSLMQVDRPVVRTADTDRVVLWVDKPLAELGTVFAAKYIRWGAKQTFASKKSKAVPVPQRATCASRNLWYDLTSDRIGVAFWPKIQQYRHIIPVNPDQLICNCNLYTLVPTLTDKRAESALGPVLNSTVVGLMKCFYGRYAGTEAALKTEVVDVNLLEIPDPRGVSTELAERLNAALDHLAARQVTGMVEERLMLCHDPEQMREIVKDTPALPKELTQSDRRDLDDAVLELLGIANAKERQSLLDELYAETTLYFRRQRVMEIQGMRNRAKASRRQVEPRDLAASLWDALVVEKADLEPVPDWLRRKFSAAQKVHIPEGKAKALGAEDFFDANAVLFKTAAGTQQLDCGNPEQAALVERLAGLNIRGDVLLPADPRACKMADQALVERMDILTRRFKELAAQRAGDKPLQEKIVETLIQWVTHGRN